MEKKIADIKADTTESMKRKFGRKIDLDEIQEAYLRRLVFDLRMSKIDVRSLYEQELKSWKVKRI